ncbi:DNA recombination protein RmuC [Bradyrhizobium sp. LMTR 3]|uniref:DNA recombination protein RmuC n=1 Tax=Bradyrhizobium sp. LMTR 3 TaxID=189873 RepID=UPI000810D0A5|nr:DNA recombination protein RmuC [Bradyrhizobium sp. LMTR 3]OCK57457.1 hypothetical protein LMTR3_21350 [Bradyrhizobium sp. LMTR 3]
MTTNLPQRCEHIWIPYGGTSPACRTVNTRSLYPAMDFTMMFIPIEPAFMIAANDKRLFSQAWEK